MIKTATLLLALLGASCASPVPPGEEEGELPPRFPGTELWLEAGLEEEGGFTFVQVSLFMFPPEPSFECSRSMNGFAPFVDGVPLTRSDGPPDAFGFVVHLACPASFFSGRAPATPDLVDFDIELRSPQESITFHVGPVAPATADAPATATAGEGVSVLGIPTGYGLTEAIATPLVNEEDDASVESWGIGLRSGWEGSYMQVPETSAGDYDVVFSYVQSSPVDRCEFHSCAADVTMHSHPHRMTVEPPLPDAGP